MAFNPFAMFPLNAKIKKKSAAFVSFIQAITSQLVDQFRFVKAGDEGFITQIYCDFSA